MHFQKKHSESHLNSHIVIEVMQHGLVHEGADIFQSIGSKQHQCPQGLDLAPVKTGNVVGNVLNKAIIEAVREKYGSQWENEHVHVKKLFGFQHEDAEGYRATWKSGGIQ